MSTNSVPRSRSRMGVRGKIFAVGAAGLTAAVAVGALAITGLGSAGTSLDEVSELDAAVSFAQTIETFNADVSGWQVAYAWDARRIGGAAAVQETEGGNRAGFLDVGQRLRDFLTTAPTDVFDEDERAIVEQIDGKWDEFFELDEQAAALYAQNTPAAVETADEVILQSGFGVYYELIDLTTALRASLDERAEAARQAADDRQ